MTGQYRPAHRVREGWQVPLRDGSWATVAKAWRVYSPANLVLLDLADGSPPATLAPDDQVLCRTLTEVRAAEKQAAQAGAA